MSIGTMTSKGQVTVPKDVRDALGLTPGTKVSFRRNAAGEYVMSTERTRLEQLRGRLARPGRVVGLDAMDAAIPHGARRRGGSRRDRRPGCTAGSCSHRRGSGGCRLR